MTHFSNLLPEDPYKRDRSFRRFYPKKPEIVDHNADVFEEVQTLDQAWIWIIGFDTLIMIIIFFVTGMPWWVFLIIGGMGAMMILFMGRIRLFSRLDREGVHIEMKPFFFGKKIIIPWKDIDTVILRKFSGILETSGRGKRSSRKKTIYRLGGNKALEITKYDGRQVVIGISEPKKVEAVLKRIIREFR